MYRIQNAAGFDDAVVSIAILEAPIAQDDNLTTGYTPNGANFDLTGDLTADNGNGADILGFPAATITDFGVLGITPPTNVPFAGGLITISNTGVFTLTNAVTGTYSFIYTLQNGLGTDTAT
ncbi:MAG TPA: hypothetical protein PLZ51_27825, partial [Aggregatilineales bacterium]|nr:hypothetical protein [Aggregatilineales bacterium]